MAGGAAPGPAASAWVSARSLLARHGLRPKKSWGQNFLEDRRVIERIVAAAAAPAGAPVVEIGAGLGALTRALADSEPGYRVTAIERDPDLVAVLRAELGDRPNLAIAAQDALEADFPGLAAAAGESLTVLGNLPYQITTPLLFRVLAAAGSVRRGVFMVQREVAERLTAPPGGKTYGRLSVMIQQAAEVAILFHVRPGAFLPPPQVTSTVFTLVPRPVPRAPVQSPALFAAVVRAAFSGRRKMIRRSLEPLAGTTLGPALLAAALDGTERPEQLAVEAFARLSDALAEAGLSAPAIGAEAVGGLDDEDRDA